MKHLWLILFVVFISLSCKKDSTDKKITTEKEAKIKKAFLTLNFGDSPQVVKNKLQTLLKDRNIIKDAEFDDSSRDDIYKYLLEINKYDIENAMALIKPYYYESKLYVVALNVVPFNSNDEYSEFLSKVDYLEVLDLIKTKRFKDLNLALNQMYIEKYGKNYRQFESEYKGIYERYWTINNLKIAFDFDLGTPRISYIDNDVAKLIKSRKIKTKDAI